ncbi:MAG: D-alanine--D-alanine ligase [Chitinophagales bacterium]|nr:D-alanine--D-alanine ligase [Bacteroidota bacterium]MBP7400391.1 D-alanine--D-alanine ligase [Chitinophagales bacterium]MBK8487746.1 D-alanine--D-alanine ligase [Bacteroidota bacterium]MBK8682499.1 D-alanine--D-alanine ligase [Bacteroidota bacterium]MBP8754912.1 D-alanine--D-alanine ligase [Chitinophagales bacterium]
MQKLNVAVMCGGFTAEQNISLLSGELVYKNLDPDRFNPFKVVVSKNKWIVEPFNTTVNLQDFSFLMGAEIVKFDAAFIAIHGSPGEDGKLQGYFDMKRIPYNNSGMFASAITANKFFCKEAIRGISIPMAKGVLVRKSDVLSEKVREIQTMQFPVFVKPNNNGSSYGISKIKLPEETEKALIHAFTFDDEVLVEEGMTGTEVTCAVFKHKDKITSLPICEIVSGKHDFFDYTAKYTDGEAEEIVPARIPADVAAMVTSSSEKIFAHLGCKGVIRIDYILKDEIPHFLEVNTVPGMSESSIVPKMLAAAGIPLREFFTNLINESL